MPEDKIIEIQSNLKKYMEDVMCKKNDTKDSSRIWNFSIKYVNYIIF